MNRTDHETLSIHLGIIKDLRVPILQPQSRTIIAVAATGHAQQYKRLLRLSSTEFFYTWGVRLVYC